MLGDPENIVVNNDSERRTALDTFHRHGVSVLPDGRKIEEVVLTQ